ncbi:MAG: hypothetical protein BroJett013_03070 [Alphaproteobacteria bacterium]|nr:MAG: hypothetical protein BroJett013_03070 [Alphaproteobacteria bacterium]
MNAAEWRALIEAYLDGRLSAEAFMRRFIDAWRVSGGAVPRAVAAMQAHVEAFEAQVAEVREEGAVSDDELRQAAQRALYNLGEEPAVSAHTFDRTRAREDMRRFQVHVSRIAGIGCLIALAWFALCILQIYYVSEWIQQSLGWGAWPSAVVGFILAFVPIVGNLLAFLGATQEGWATWAAAIVFFAAPAATFLSGWSRWRRPGSRG